MRDLTIIITASVPDDYNQDTADRLAMDAHVQVVEPHDDIMEKVSDFPQDVRVNAFISEIR